MSERYVFLVMVQDNEKLKTTTRTSPPHVDSVWITYEAAKKRMEQANNYNPYTRDYQRYQVASIRTAAFEPERTVDSTALLSGYGENTPSRYENQFDVNKDNWRTLSDEAKYA